MSADLGSAPNFEPPTATLAICKPRLRRSAIEGDAIISFNGAHLSSEPHSIRWAGVVSEVLTFEQYWDDGRFEAKKPSHSSVPDNIYQPVDGILKQVANSIHGPDNIITDLDGRNVLIFDRAWYFGELEPGLPEHFGLWMVGNRRTEPCHLMTDSEWDEIRRWLDRQDQMQPSQFGGSCKPRDCTQNSEAEPLQLTGGGRKRRVC
ncbi:MAG: hypothetical protein ACT4OE_11590 [Sphingosinicella sp.]